MQPRIGYRIPRKEYIKVKGGNFTEYIQVPRQSTYKEAAIFYEPLGQNFYGSTGTSWISLGGSVVSAPETVVSTNQATLVNGNAEVRRLIGGSGMMVTDTYLGDDNYATLQGYDYSNDIQTIGDAAFSDAITIAIPDSTGYLFKIYIRGYNTTTNKVYSYDYTVSAKALAGVVSVSSTASMQVVEDLDPVVVSFAGGASFKVKVKGLAGATINWSTKVRKI